MEEEKQTFKSDKDLKDSKEFKDQKKSNKGRRPGRGRKLSKERRIDHNDFSWLNHEDELVKIAAKLPMSRFAGQNITLSKYYSGNGTVVDDVSSIPGIMVIQALLTAGTAKDGNSAFNYAIRVLWTRLRSATSGTIPVSVNDLAVYVLALGQLLGGLGYVDRILNTIGAFKPLNRYTPERLLQAMGMNYEDVVKHYSTLLFKSAYWKSCLRALVFPNMDYFKNCYYIFSKIYVDSQAAEQGQFYLFNPIAFGRYNSVGSEAGATLDYDVYTDIDDGSENDVEFLISSIDTLFNAILNDDLINNVSGFLKRMESSSLLATTSYDTILSMGSTEYAIYDPEILLQIHNLRCFPCGQASEMKFKMIPQIGSANDFSYYKFTFDDKIKTYQSVRVPEYFLDPLVTNPSDEVIVMSSRLAPVTTVTTDGTVCKIGLDSWDIMIPIRIFYKSGTHSDSAVYGANIENGVCLENVNTFSSYIPVTQFDYHPIFTVWSSTLDRAILLGDVYNLQPVSTKAIDNLHTAKLISLMSTK